jgi:hypothetical protein
MKVRLLGVDCSWLYNACKSHIFFSQEPVFTNVKWGSWTVNRNGAERSQRCAVMVEANFSGG